ncbi:MAG TPA: metalloregulator ArsR/SmtB family transcription factor [Acidobacteriota bacterium]|nr:metalloregulator ArsR/SmtB family transcription factor [Acidobacteriota bacterium]
MTNIKSKFQFQLHPWFEVFYALQTLTDQVSRIHSEWKRRAAQRLPSTFNKKLQLVGGSPYIWPAVADLLLDLPLTVSFEDRITALARLSVQEFQKTIVFGLLHEQEPVEKLLSGKFDLHQTITHISKTKREWLSFIGLYPPEKSSALFKGLEMLVRTPGEFRKYVVDLVQIFWEKEFSATWDQIYNKLEESKEEKERLFESCTLQEFTQLALLRVEVDERKGELKALRGGYTLPLRNLANAIIMPSAFNDKRHWTVSYKNPSKVTAFLPYFDPAISLSWIPAREKLEAQQPELDPALIFRALGDTTRYAMVSLLAKQPLTSADLAKILSLSRPTVSHHIHLLREAGLIDEKVHGNALLLSLKVEVFQNLSEIVSNKLFQNNSETRKSKSK